MSEVCKELNCCLPPVPVALPFKSKHDLIKAVQIVALSKEKIREIGAAMEEINEFGIRRKNMKTENINLNNANNGKTEGKTKVHPNFLSLNNITFYGYSYSKKVRHTKKNEPYDVMVTELQYTRDLSIPRNGGQVTVTHFIDTVSAEAPAEIADQYTGLAVCIAKLAFGGNENYTEFGKFADFVINKLPKIQLKEEKAEAARVAAKKEAEKQLAGKKYKAAVKRRAYEIKLEHEARQLANEKYGIPVEEPQNKNNI